MFLFEERHWGRGLNVPSFSDQWQVQAPSVGKNNFSAVPISLDAYISEPLGSNVHAATTIATSPSSSPPSRNTRAASRILAILSLMTLIDSKNILSGGYGPSDSTMTMSSLLVSPLENDKVQSWHTQKEVSYSAQRDRICELWMSQHLSADAVFPHITFVNAYSLCFGIDLDNAR